ncbi:uncharacterized protein LOC129594040 [Paramacrobiotus metropolitanus]|uniref:uncharacterized protein LOC129594040 n=1 Tax=Paramacrobiotus metropolitanus TaxID=2943436 RepID=UPI0024456A15|nr:uncharacterized protein LOC129594040 [Paramacrobiotus metropolitanus]
MKPVVFIGICLALSTSWIASEAALGCPNGQPMFNCFVQPCRFASCPAHPSAKCSDDYCGGCKARFYVGTREVTSTCASTAITSTRSRRNTQDCPMIKCPADQVVKCKVEPCRGKTCPNRPNARCCNSYCGGCRWSFHENYQDVTSQCR